MRNWKGLVAITGLLVLLFAWGPVARAEDPAVPDDESGGVEEPAVADESGQDATDKEKMPFALYLSAAGGFGSADELQTSIAADELNIGVSEVEIDDELYGQAAIGWKLPRGKGAFRLVFNGLREEEYEFRSVGVSNALPSGEQVDIDSGLIPSWFISVKDGDLDATRLVPMWSLADDGDPDIGDGDGKPDFGSCSDLDSGMVRCGEITYDPSSPDRVVTGTLPDDLENRITTYDAVYGREFGGRRYHSQWWAGFRYFKYEGQLFASAWLNLTDAQFTDGSTLRLLNVTQDSSGLGPVGAWEAQFRFFDQALELFLRGEAAFTFNELEMDSGPFFQILDESSGTTLDDRLVKSLDKSSWQGRAEAGARWHLKNGLSFEVAYAQTGYTDIVLLPDLLQVGVTNEEPQTNTQDFIIDLFHFGVVFQF